MAGPDEMFASDSQRVIGRYGDTVHRKVGPWTPAVHALLEHLRSVGFPYAPRVIDGGRPDVEVLSYLDGVSGRDAWVKVVPETGLRAFAVLLRRYHEAVADYRPADQRWATGRADVTGDDIVCHGDFGPWNTVWRGDQPVGIVDWDLAGPRPRMYDIAYALEYVAPFRDDEECTRWLGHRAPPDRAHRIAVFAEAYGLPSTAGLYDAVVTAQQVGIDEVQRLADQGIHPQADWVAAGHLTELDERVRWTRENRALFEAEP